MTLSPHPRSTAASLLRLLAAWLAAIVLVQGVGAAQALGLGPLHRHDDTAAHHEHRHSDAERHHHAGDDSSVLPAPQLELDSTAFALTAALALMALGSVRWWLERRRHVWRAAALRAWRSTTPIPLRRPPRRC